MPSRDKTAQVEKHWSTGTLSGVGKLRKERSRKETECEVPHAGVQCTSVRTLEAAGAVTGTYQHFL